jgi:serine/alanine adding enzyme
MMTSDVYFSKEYAQLYTGHDHDEAVEYNHTSEWGEVKYIFIKREIPDRINGKVYYDLITPYGYGGPILMNILDHNKIDQMVESFANDFNTYCESSDIVSEVILFHPLLQNMVSFESIYDVSFYKETVYIDLKDEETIWNNMKATCQNRIRKGKNYGFTVARDLSSKSLHKFIELYYRTMDKHKARDFYYFDETYFSRLMALETSSEIFNLMMNQQTIASIIVLKGEKFIHYHLGATDPDYYAMSPNNLLFYEVAKWGSTNGYQKFHLGGGYSSPDDGLFRFKHTLNINGVLKCCIGKKIRNPRIYDQLTQIHMRKSCVDENRSFFPAYRK